MNGAASHLIDEKEPQRAGQDLRQTKGGWPGREGTSKAWIAYVQVTFSQGTTGVVTQMMFLMLTRWFQADLLKVPLPPTSSPGQLETIID